MRPSIAPESPVRGLSCALANRSRPRERAIVDRRGASRIRLLDGRRPPTRRRRLRSDRATSTRSETLVGRGAVAIGECGLDYHYDHSPRDLQRRAFAAQLALARELDRPVVVHTREAETDTRAMVAEAGRSGSSRRVALLHRVARPRRDGTRRRLVRLVQRHRHLQEMGRRRAHSPRSRRPGARRIGLAISRAVPQPREAERAGVG